MITTSFVKNKGEYTYTKSGFTLAELMVCVSIIALLSLILLGNRNTYVERLVLKNETYKVSLAIRQAQVQSLSVKGFTGGGSPTKFDTSYGISFYADDPQDRFILFADQNDNGQYDAGGEQSEIISLSGNVVIQSVCGNNGSSCYASTGNFQKVTIRFKRPDPSALMRFMNNGGNTSGGINPPVVINLISKTGITSSVKVESTGAISIQGL